MAWANPVLDRDLLGPDQPDEFCHLQGRGSELPVCGARTAKGCVRKGVGHPPSNTCPWCYRTTCPQCMSIMRTYRLFGGAYEGS